MVIKIRCVLGAVKGKYHSMMFLVLKWLNKKDYLRIVSNVFHGKIQMNLLSVTKKALNWLIEDLITNIM